ncbi:hypothetical protein SETIT_8G149900v2 [Setaria italica]|uniref:FAR1 domain-containing protein n=1 Tax=Setaria italica TaxID=4555 RepID=K3ZMS7_SETIT|nr:hypothetical protein SETIT_8G149900v2 [Setaria italica]
MPAHTQTLEELEEYEYIVERTFHSEDEGYEFFNAFARNKGFSGRGRLHTQQTKMSRQYVCSKEGAGQPKFLNRETMKRRPRPVTRFDCPFEVVMRHKPEMNIWYVHKYLYTHNHNFRASEKRNILAYQTAGLRKYQIMDVMEKQYGGPHNVGYVIKDLYNFHF